MVLIHLSVHLFDLSIDLLSLLSGLLPKRLNVIKHALSCELDLGLHDNFGFGIVDSLKFEIEILPPNDSSQFYGERLIENLLLKDGLVRHHDIEGDVFFIILLHRLVFLIFFYGLLRLLVNFCLLLGLASDELNLALVLLFEATDRSVIKLELDLAVGLYRHIHRVE